MNIIVAKCLKNGIGKNNKIPWKLSNDLKFFKDITIGNGNNAIIMGRNTYESLNYKTLPKRDNFILTKTLRNMNDDNGYIFSENIEMLNYINNKNYDNVWVIGGSNIYNQYIHSGLVDSLLITDINKEYNHDVCFPDIPKNYNKIWESTKIIENDIPYNIKLYWNFHKIIDYKYATNIIEMCNKSYNL